jgi:DNA-binding transcriptional activator of the SARP family
VRGWHLSTLGARAALRHPESGTEITRLRTPRAFALLASLALDPATLTVGALALRLWPDSSSVDAPATNLRAAIRALRQEVDADLFANERGVVRLAPGALARVDLLDAEATWETIRRTPLAQLPHAERAAQLREMARTLAAGPFLPGIDIPGSDWLDGVRTRTEALSAEVHLALAEALEAGGNPADRRAAYEAAAHAYALFPHLDAALALLVRLADAAPPRRGGARPPTDLEGLLSHLEEETEARDGSHRALTVREERALDAALDAALRPFPIPVQVAFARLGVFPQAFTPEQACAIGGSAAATEALEALAGAGLLRRVGGERFEIPAAARERALARLSPAQRRTARARHTGHFVRCILDELRYIRPRTPAAVQWITQEEANWRRALTERFKRPIDQEMYECIDILAYHAVALGEPLVRELHRDAAARFEEAYHAGVGEAFWPAGALAVHAHREGDFAAALRWARIAFDSLIAHPGARSADDEALRAEIAGSLANTVVHALMAAHFGGDDAEFASALELAEIAERTLEPWPERVLLFRTTLCGLRAENLYARRCYDEALEFAQAESRLLEEAIATHPNMVLHRPGAHYRRGCILARMGSEREDAALAAFDAALTLYHAHPELGQHGVADCLQQTAAILGRRPGLGALGRQQAEQAVTIYASIGAADSRAAALGTLGDLLAFAGQVTRARALYEEGYAHWRERGHARWISRFAERLARLEKAVG